MKKARQSWRTVFNNNHFYRRKCEGGSIIPHFQICHTQRNNYNSGIHSASGGSARGAGACVARPTPCKTDISCAICLPLWPTSRLRFRTSSRIEAYCRVWGPLTANVRKLSPNIGYRACSVVALPLPTKFPSSVGHVGWSLAVAIGVFVQGSRLICCPLKTANPQSGTWLASGSCNRLLRLEIRAAIGVSIKNCQSSVGHVVGQWQL